MSSSFLLLQNMLVEIEQKVVALSELSVHNENLLLEGKAHTKEEAEQLAVKLRTLKGSLLELQRALHDKQLNIQVRPPVTAAAGPATLLNPRALLLGLFCAQCPQRKIWGRTHISPWISFTHILALIFRQIL